MSIAVVSSCYGGVDVLTSPPTQTLEPDEWVMVTDEAAVPAGWRHVHQPRGWVHTRYAAKHAKALPFDYTDADIAIWLDTGARIKSPGLIGWLIDQIGDADMALWRHPERDNIDAESQVSSQIPKYKGMHSLYQAAHYIGRGLPPGLWATGCIVWRNTDANRQLGAAWLAEQLRWSLQDQISFPYVLWQSGIQPVALAENLWHNRYVTWTGH